MISPEDLTVLVWQKLKTPKDQRIKYSLASAREFLSNPYFTDEKIESGETGFYCQTFLTVRNDEGPKPTKYHWLILDVEAPGDHDSVAHNIQAAQDLFTALAAHDLVAGLEVLLTGRGFRFVWPYVLPADFGKAWLAMVRDQERFPFIDPAPQNGRNGIRVLAYRGGPDQDRGRQDIHVQPLDSPLQLFGLTVESYGRLVVAPPSADVYRRTLPRLLPNAWAPRPWLEFLDAYKRQTAFESCIWEPVFSPRGPVRNVGVNWEDITAFLARTNNPVYKTLEHAFGPIHKLRICPVCGKSEGEPFITHTGRLKCFRATCEAHISSVRDDRNRPGGLPPSQWVEGYSGGEIDYPIPEGMLTVGQGRELIDQALAADDDVVIRATPGLGKSYGAIGYAIERAKDGLVLYSLPDAKLVKEKSEEAAQRCGDKERDFEDRLVRRIEGRRDDRTGQQKLDFDYNCTKANHAKDIGQRGFSPGALLCARCSTKFGDGGCSYRRQFENLPDRGIIFTTHKQVEAVMRKLPVNPTTWIIDESPKEAYLTAVTISMESMDRIEALLSPEAAEVLDKFRSAAYDLLKTGKLVPKPGEEYSGKHGRLYATRPPEDTQWADLVHDLWDLAETTEDQRKVLETDIKNKFGQGPDESFTAWQQRLLGKGVELIAIDWLKTALGRRKGTAYIKAQHGGKGDPYTFEARYRDIPENLKDETRLIVLDGTGEQAEMERLFGRPFRLVEAKAAVDDRCRLIHLQRGLGKVKAGMLSDASIRSLLREALNRLRWVDFKILIVTFKYIEERALEIARELKPDLEFASLHHWAGRGVNSYKGHDAVIALGTPRVSPAGTLDQACALFDTKEEREQWQRRQGEADLFQSLNRVRPIHGPRTIIVMGDAGAWPSDLGPPTLAIDQTRKGRREQDLAEAVERCTTFIEAYGFIAAEFAWGLGIAQSHQAESLQQTLDWMRRLRADPDQSNIFTVPTLINNILESAQWFCSIRRIEPILFTNGHGWPELIRRLSVRFPDLPELQARSVLTGNPWKAGLGYLDSVKAFHAQANYQFNQNQWQGVMRPEPWTRESRIDETVTAHAVAAQPAGRYAPPPGRGCLLDLNQAARL